MSTGQRLRCAVYTRKSSEEGLKQEFNSLDAQREACSAFIASQVGLGWKLVPDRYDDGGISGGTMEGPALRRLLTDIAAKKVDVVVVYKTNRLTTDCLRGVWRGAISRFSGASNFLQSPDCYEPTDHKAAGTFFTTMTSPRDAKHHLLHIKAMQHHQMRKLVVRETSLKRRQAEKR